MKENELEPTELETLGGEPPSVERAPRMLRVRLWQAVAGMSLAVVIGSLLVVKDLAESLARRTNYVNRRVAALNASVRTLRRQTAVEQKKLGSERERATAGEMFEKILFAPDLRFIRLGAPIEKEKEKGKEKSIVQLPIGGLPYGTLAMSQLNQAAMLEANGLKPTGTFQVYRIWWMPKRGVPVWAADFLVGDDGSATTAVDLPTGREKEMSLEITLEDESYSEAPNGPVALAEEAPPVAGNRRRGRR
jgi:Anti-sigma-K factor rskA